MEFVRLGKSGLVVSRLCFGMMAFGDPAWRAWILGENDARPIVHRAWEAGINFYDTADMYSRGESERVTGRLLHELAPRDQWILATKVYWPMSDRPNDRGLSRKHILDSVHGSLKRLGTDYIDLYYIHRWHYGTPIEETLSTLNGLVESGKVRYLGASSMFAWQFAKALYLADLHGWERFVAMQNHYNLIYREEEREMNPLCREEGVGLLPWSPLARGYLAGNRFPGEEKPTARAKSDRYADMLYTHPTDPTVVEALHRVAGRIGRAPMQVALGWMLGKEGVVSPVIGSTKPDHIDEAVKAIDLKLSDEDVAELEAKYEPHPIEGHGEYGVESYA